jgi:hypothetical protein
MKLIVEAGATEGASKRRDWLSHAEALEAAGLSE